MIEIQTDFQRQVSSLKKELEDEKQARLKLEAEVTEFFRISKQVLINCFCAGSDFKKVGQ